MGRGDQIVIFYREIVNRRHWQIQLQRLPMRPVIKRHEDAELSSRVKQAFAPGIFAHGVDIGAFGNPVRNCAPIFSKIGCFENVRLEIVQLVPVHRNVRGICVVWRSVDDTDCAPVGHLRCDL